MSTDVDTAASGRIMIGAVSIGLVGLGPALRQAADQGLDDERAADFLLATLRRDNYIPPGREDDYRQALAEAYRAHTGRGEAKAGGLSIRIFGKDCIGCNNLHAVVFEVLGRMGLAADIEMIHDPDEIGRHGILITPALVVNGRLKGGGRLPSPAQVEAWIREELDA